MAASNRRRTSLRRRRLETICPSLALQRRGRAGPVKISLFIATVLKDVLKDTCNDGALPDTGAPRHRLRWAANEDRLAVIPVGLKRAQLARHARATEAELTRRLAVTVTRSLVD